MPTKPQKIKRPWVIERPAFFREQSNYDFYNSTEWRKRSHQYRSEHPLCEQCETENLITPATVTDHIIPINQGGNKFESSNLKALCAKCHNKKSGGERGGIGVKSL